MAAIHRVLCVSSLSHLSVVSRNSAKSFQKALTPSITATTWSLLSLSLTNPTKLRLHPTVSTSMHLTNNGGSIFGPSLFNPNTTTITFTLAADDEMLPAFRRLGLFSFTSSTASPRVVLTNTVRAYSSSSRSPADGSSSRAVPPAVASGNSSTTPRTTTKRLLSGGGGIPFVPSTDHLHPAGMLSLSTAPLPPASAFRPVCYPLTKHSVLADVALAAFFAEHRPISIAPTSTPLTLTAPPQHRRVIERHDPLSPWEFGIPFQPPGPPEQMQAISVKRQRKLKMKKHKYKKLMKKTRNQRRRIERQKN